MVPQLIVLKCERHLPHSRWWACWHWLPEVRWLWRIAQSHQGPGASWAWHHQRSSTVASRQAPWGSTAPAALEAAGSLSERGCTGWCSCNNKTNFQAVQLNQDKNACEVSRGVKIKFSLSKTIELKNDKNQYFFMRICITYYSKRPNHLRHINNYYNTSN